jgi:hypothetical protein
MANPEQVIAEALKPGACPIDTPIVVVSALRAAGLLPGPDTIAVNREALAHLLRHGAPDMAVTSLDDAARWDDISDALRAALSESPAPKEQQP